MKKDIKIIFVDIDWTIFNHSSFPSFYDFESIDALRKAQKQGVKIFINTARPYHSVEQIRLLDLFVPDGMILCNGGVILYEDKVLYSSNIPVKDFEKICDLAKENDLNLEGVRLYDCFMIAKENEAVRALFDTYPEDMPKVMDYHGQKTVGICLFAPKEFDDLFIANLPKDYVYFRYHDYGVDIAPAPHDKGEAIKIVLDKLNISKDYAMAIGDDTVDISMFKQVKYGVAMGNGNEEVLKNADHITSHINEHGVKQVIEEFVLK